ncbi:MAG TPA: hypothetical protein VF950_23505 [Planctomycetota bacterium]
MEMPIQVISTYEENGRCVANIAAPHGDAVVVWKGENRPNPGRYIVELEISGAQEGADCPRQTTKKQYSMHSDKAGVFLTGKIDGHYEYGLGFRLGDSVLILDSPSPDLSVGQWVELGPVTLDAFPVNY